MYWNIRYTNFRLIPSFSMFFFFKKCGTRCKNICWVYYMSFSQRKISYLKKRPKNLKPFSYLLFACINCFLFHLKCINVSRKKRELLQAPFSQSFTSRTWSMNSHQGTKRLKDRNTPLNTACRTENIVKPQHFFQETLFEYSTYFKQHRIHYQIT